MTVSHHLLIGAAVLWAAVTPAQVTAQPSVAAEATSRQTPQAPDHRPVLLISIDGLTSSSLLAIGKDDLDIPVLRSLVREGSYAERVINVNPTVTNPNHTSLVTGVSPARHGVYNNRPFSPTAKLPSSYSLYSSIKAPTLWSAAKAEGLKTASLYWPVTRNSEHIDVNIIDGDSKEDAQITNDAIKIITEQHPHFMTVHYVTYDSAQHAHGPRTPEAVKSLERIDREIGRLLATYRALHPYGVIAIASDHGFDRTTREVNFNKAFADAGLISFTDDTRSEVTTWRAFAWYIGASAMVVLNDPTDGTLDAEVRDFLRKLATNPEAGVEKILGPESLIGTGMSPQARYVIALKPGYRMGNAMNGPFSAPYHGGSHGAFTAEATRQDMHSAFIIVGKGIKQNASLGTIDIRQIAPTLAKLLNVPFSQAQADPLDLLE